MSAPKPTNFDALSVAWDDPVAFTAELHKYYQQLADAGVHLPTEDWTRPRRDDDREQG